MSDDIRIRELPSSNGAELWEVEDPRRQGRTWRIELVAEDDGTWRARELGTGTTTVFQPMQDLPGIVYTPVQIYDTDGNRQRALNYGDLPDHYAFGQNLGARVEYLEDPAASDGQTGDVLVWKVRVDKPALMAALHVLQRHWNEARRATATQSQRESAPRSHIVLHGLGFSQHGHRYVSFVATAAELLKFVEVIPNTEQHPNYPQRPVDAKRLRRIGDFVVGGGALLPSIIVNFYDSVDVDFQDNNEVCISIPNDGGKHAYCIDGQHRLFAFDPEKSPHSEEELGADRMELPVTAMVREPEKVWVDQFLVINTKQVPVNRDQILGLQQYYGETSKSEGLAVEIARKLNASQSCALFEKIFMRPGERNRMIKLRNFVRLLKGHLEENSTFWDHRTGSPNADLLAALLENYVNAWRDLFPNEWDSNQHVLTKTAGWEVMFSPAGVLSKAFERLNRSYRATLEDWKRVLKPLRSLEISLRNRDIPLTWESHTFRPYCSGRANIDNFVRAVHRAYSERITE